MLKGAVVAKFEILRKTTKTVRLKFESRILILRSATHSTAVLMIIVIILKTRYLEDTEEVK